jgi:hypothetical protein
LTISATSFFAIVAVEIVPVHVITSDALADSRDHVDVAIRHGLGRYTGRGSSSSLGH